VHRKLVALALLVSGTALAFVVVGLTFVDVWRFRQTSSRDAEALARVLSENTAAGVAFGYTEEVARILSSVRVRPQVTLACIYLPSGRLFTGYSRDGECPAEPPTRLPFGRVAGSSPVMRNDVHYGLVYVEQRLSDLRDRLLFTSFVGALMLIGATLSAFLLAQRVHGAVSKPIGDLVDAARNFGRDQTMEIPNVRSSPDEVGELAATFREMAGRVRASSEELQQSNDALRREIDERRRIEREREAALAREREASRLKDEFLAAVSHEIRTPLNAIAGWAQVLGSRAADDHTRRRAIEAILRNVQAQTTVINDLIDISRSVSGKLRLSFAPVDMRGVVLAAVEAVQPTAAARNITLTSHVPESPCEVAGDRDRLRQVLWNLLSNAVKFTPPGGAVTVDLFGGSGGVTVRVADTGIGIAPDFLPHVFERFRQADGSVTREHGGLGLGLSIARDLTELHGGRLEAHSDGRDKGAVFTVLLPALSADRASAVARHATELDPQPTLSGVRVLAVDDNDDALEVMAVALTEAGAIVRLARTGEMAVKAWAEKHSDVLVCDIAMPHLSGFDVLERVRDIDERAGRTTRAVAVTAHVSEHVQKDCRDAGFGEYVAKPFEAAQLVRAVAAVAGRVYERT
jgi:signal transduction histidine kinase/CheY-like chemotaxis protein